MTKQQIEEKLMEVMDPELHISIFDLGLINDVQINGANVRIRMTLTTLGCPLFDTIEKDIRDALEECGVEGECIDIELTFDPPWSMDRMTERGKAIIGI
ncbi:metal-sulfur cluster assembly factor [Candidatus Woesebacteria bacterium]|nr:metal-sulfur cluster assembly factor [Candidatus Woesebacteria bacterium]